MAGEFAIANSENQVTDSVSRMRRNFLKKCKGIALDHLCQERFQSNLAWEENSRKVSLPECERFETCSSLTLRLYEIPNVKHSLQTMSRIPSRTFSKELTVNLNSGAMSQLLQTSL